MLAIAIIMFLTLEKGQNVYLSLFLSFPRSLTYFIQTLLSLRRDVTALYVFKEGC